MTKRNSTRTSVKVQHDQKTLDFIRRSKAVHGEKFSYEKTVFVSQKVKFTIICKKCGSEFQVRYCNHIHNKTGCRQCRLDNDRWTRESFEKIGKRVHGDFYDYSKVKYINSSTKVVITCPEHGDFKIRPDNHTRRIGAQGCPQCAVKTMDGWTRRDFKERCSKNREKLGFLYVIECKKDNEVFYKVGITSRMLSTRFSKKEAMPYSYRELCLIENEPFFIYDLELRLHKMLKDYAYEPQIKFAGHTECFTTIEPIKNLLKRLSKTKQLQLIA